MILVEIKSNSSIVSRKFQVLFCVSQDLSSACLPPLLCAFWVLFPVFCPALVPGNPKDTGRDFSSTNNPCRQKKESLETVIPPNSMAIGKCRDHLQATRGLWNSHLSSTENQAYFYSTSFMGKILPNSHLS